MSVFYTLTPLPSIKATCNARIKMSSPDSAFYKPHSKRLLSISILAYILHAWIWSHEAFDMKNFNREGMEKEMIVRQ